MKKRTIVLMITVIIIGMVYLIFHNVYRKPLSDFDVSKLEKCDVIDSPDHTKKIIVYFNRGILGTLILV